jgi:hypothetical protein
MVNACLGVNFGSTYRCFGESKVFCIFWGVRIGRGMKAKKHSSKKALDSTGCFKISRDFSHAKIFEHLPRNFFLTKETCSFRTSLKAVAAKFLRSS